MLSTADGEKAGGGVDAGGTRTFSLSARQAPHLADAAGRQPAGPAMPSVDQKH